MKVQAKVEWRSRPAAKADSVRIGKRALWLGLLLMQQDLVGAQVLQYQTMKGKIRIAPDFDDLPDDVLAAFRGERP